MPIGARGPNSRQGTGRHSWIAQCTRSPTRPTSAAQRGGWWSVPRRRHRLPVIGSARPSGTGPPSPPHSSRAKSTRKLAQQAPQAKQGLPAADKAYSRTTVTVQAACATTCELTLPKWRRSTDAPRAPITM